MSDLSILGVEFAKTVNDGDPDLPPEQAQVHFEYITLTAYVQNGKQIIIELDGDVDGEVFMAPFKVYRNDGLVYEEGGS